MRAASARELRTTDFCSMPIDASSAAGLQIAGKPTLVNSSPRRASDQRGTGRPALSSRVFTTFLWRQSAVVALELPECGMPNSSSTEMTIGSNSATPSIPSHKVEDKIELRASHPLDPAAVGIDGNAHRYVALAPRGDCALDRLD